MTEPNPTRQPEDRSPGWFAWPTLRWAALAAGVVVVGSVLLLQPGKQSDSTLGTEPLAAQGQSPAPPAITPAPSSTPAPQAQADIPAAKLNSAPMREARGLRNQQIAGGAGTAVATPAISLADKKRVDVLQDKGDLSHRAGGSATGAGAAEAKTEASSMAQAASVKPKDLATVNGAIGEAQPSLAQGGLMARNEAPVPPVEKAKPAAKEQIEVDSQAVQIVPQESMSVAAAETNSVARQKQLMKLSEVVVAPQWSLAQGKLRRSVDAGKSWKTALPVEHPILAFGVLGNDVWAGRRGGVLYHSIDDGSTWTTIQPSTKSVPLAADIVAIEIRSATEVHLSTGAGESWITTDAGKTWEKK